MPPARAALLLSSLAGIGWLVRALWVGPPPLVSALVALFGYLVLVLVGVVASGLRMFADVLTRGPSNARGVVLTFDDGPDPLTTLQLLDALERAQAHATFFVAPRKVLAHPELARAIVQRGHAIGLYGPADERFFALRGRVRVRRLFTEALATVERECGVRPSLFRPAGGHVSPAMAAVAEELDVLVIGWSVGGPGDRWSRNEAALERRFGNGLRDGAIVLLPGASQGSPPSAASLGALAVVLHALVRLQLGTVRIDEWLDAD